MRLQINNFAKIGQSDIILDGITIIAGENNTGKSTVGKILFSLFNALCDIEDKVRKERLAEIRNTTFTILQNNISGLDISRNTLTRNSLRLSRQIRQQIKETFEENSEITKQDILEMVEDELNVWDDLRAGMTHYEWDGLVEQLTQNISEILELSEKDIIREVITGYFGNVFHDQISSLVNKDNAATLLRLEIKGRNNTVVFEENRCKEFESEIDLTNKAIYIDNPFIIDELASSSSMNPMNKLLKELLADTEDTEAMDGIIETLRAKEKLSVIYDALARVVDGNIERNKVDDEFYLKSDCFEEPLSFHNLSAGMKSFVVLKMLVEKGCIKEKDVIILDEPEIHLHPQWQVAYAELIVLLQKHFDLNIVVTTHSPYFVDAINLFSCKYDIDKKVNYYLSTNMGAVAKMENVTDHIDAIYKKMASPIQILDTLRYELNNF